MVLARRTRHGARAGGAGGAILPTRERGGRAALRYFTRVSPRHRGGQREGEHGGHGGEYGHAAAEAPRAPRPHPGCPPPGRAPDVAMETHGPVRPGEGGRGGPKDSASPELPEREASAARAAASGSGVGSLPGPHLPPPGAGRGHGPPGTSRPGVRG